MSHYTMLCKYGKQTHDFWGIFVLVSPNFLYIGGVFNETIIPCALVGYEIGYSQLGPMDLVGYLLSHIQHTLMEQLLNILQGDILSHALLFYILM